MNYSNYYNYYNIKQIFELTKKSYNTITFSYFVFLIAGLYLGFFQISADFQQSEFYKIIYIHVPSAWMSMLIYVLMTLFSILFLLYKNPIFYIILKNLISIGSIYTLITLITGSIWGKPTWGTWWVWDVRLTSVLILFIIYLILILLYKILEENLNTYYIISIITIIGCINIPIIKLSVQWWTTLHQTSSISQYESSIHISILIAMLLIFISFIIYTIIYIYLSLRFELLQKKYNL